MLSRQIYTPKYSNIQNIFATSQNVFGKQTDERREVSIENSLDVRISSAKQEQCIILGVQEITGEDLSSKVISKSLLGDTLSTICNIQCPTSPQNKVKHEIETITQTEQTQPIHIFQYTTKLSTELFDPTIINTPPSKFMNHLKSRLDEYYSTSV